jgi:hypothetical protein
MENLMVIRVEVIAPEKPLVVNTSSKNIISVDSIICKRPRISFVLTWSVAIAKNNYVDLGLSVRTKNKLSSIKPTLYSRSVSSLSLSPHFAISRSLFLCVLSMIHL